MSSSAATRRWAGHSKVSSHQIKQTGWKCSLANHSSCHHATEKTLSNDKNDCKGVNMIIWSLCLDALCTAWKSASKCIGAQCPGRSHHGEEGNQSYHAPRSSCSLLNMSFGESKTCHFEESKTCHLGSLWQSFGESKTCHLGSLKQVIWGVWNMSFGIWGV